MTTAYARGDIEPGQAMTAVAVSGEQVPVGNFTDDPKLLGRLLRYAKGKREPSPEDVFAKDQAKEIEAAADKVWNSDGPDGLLVRFETGALEVSPAVAKTLDRRIQRRNVEADRTTYGYVHGVVR